MNDNEKTIWKNSLFRKYPNGIESLSTPSSFPEFRGSGQSSTSQIIQTEETDTNNEINEMENKIKKINKRKRYNENFKNIEELHNIYETKCTAESPFSTPLRLQTNSKKEALTKNDFCRRSGVEDSTEALNSEVEDTRVSKCSKDTDTQENFKDTDTEKTKNKKEKRKSQLKSSLPSMKDSKKENFAKKETEGFSEEDKKKDNISFIYYILYIWIDGLYYLIMFLYNLLNDTVYNFSYKITKQYFGSESDFDKEVNLDLNIDLSNKAIVSNIEKSFSNDDSDSNKKENNFVNEEKIVNDSNILTKIIISILIFPIAIIMTYNWFYLLCYYDENSVQCIDENSNCKNKLVSFMCCRPAHDSQRLSITWGTDIKVNLFLDCLIAPLAIIDQLLLGSRYHLMNPLKSRDDYSDEKYILPYTVPTLLLFLYQVFFSMGLSLRIIQKFIVAFFSLIILYNSSLFSSIDAIVNNKLNNASTWIITTILFLYFFSNLFQLMFFDILDYCTEIIKTQPISGVVFFILMIIFCAFLRFIVVFFSLKISILLVILYIWFHSIFGIWWYKIEKKYDGVSVTESIGDKLTNMNIFINKDFGYLKGNDECKDSTILIKIIKFIALALLNNMFIYFFIGLIVKNMEACNSMYSSNIYLGTLFCLGFLLFLCIMKVIFYTT